MPDDLPPPGAPQGPMGPPPAYGSTGMEPPPPPPAGEYTTRRSSEDMVMLILSYVSLLAIVPYLGSKNDDVRWHAKQGLTLTAVFLATTVALWILTALPLIGWIAALARALVNLVYLLAMIAGIAKALGGERWRMPLIGDLAARW